MAFRKESVKTNSLVIQKKIVLYGSLQRLEKAHEFQNDNDNH